MARVKSLLKRYEIQIAKAQRTCKFNKSIKIPKGGPCFVVYEDSRKRSNYSMQTARQILAQAKEELKNLETEITEPNVRDEE